MSFLKAKRNIEMFKDYEKDHHLIKNDIKIDHIEWFNIKYADFLMSRSKFDDAIFYLNETLNLMEKNKSKMAEPFIIERLGTIEMYKNNLAKAIEYFEKTLILKNDYYNVMSNLASLYYKIGDNINASKYYTKLIQNNPEDPFFPLRSSLYNFSVGNYLKSYEHITLAREFEYQYDAVVKLLYMMINNKLNLSEIKCDNIDFNDYVDEVYEGNKINYKLKNSGKIIPNFLVNKDEEDISFEDTFDALKIVGDFLDKTIVKPNNLNFPKTRFNFQNSLKLI